MIANYDDGFSAQTTFNSVIKAPARCVGVYACCHSIRASSNSTPRKSDVLVLGNQHTPHLPQIINNHLRFSASRPSETLAVTRGQIRTAYTHTVTPQSSTSASRITFTIPASSVSILLCLQSPLVRSIYHPGLQFQTICSVCSNPPPRELPYYSPFE
jgi:hypothetical protein